MIEKGISLDSSFNTQISTESEFSPVQEKTYKKIQFLSFIIGFPFLLFVPPIVNIMASHKEPISYITYLLSYYLNFWQKYGVRLEGTDSLSIIELFIVLIIAWFVTTYIISSAKFSKILLYVSISLLLSSLMLVYFATKPCFGFCLFTASFLINDFYIPLVFLFSTCLSLALIRNKYWYLIGTNNSVNKSILGKLFLIEGGIFLIQIPLIYFLIMNNPYGGGLTSIDNYTSIGESTLANVGVFQPAYLPQVIVLKQKHPNPVNNSDINYVTGIAHIYDCNSGDKFWEGCLVITQDSASLFDWNLTKFKAVYSNYKQKKVSINNSSGYYLENTSYYRDSVLSRMYYDNPTYFENGMIWNAYQSHFEIRSYDSCDPLCSFSEGELIKIAQSMR